MNELKREIDQATLRDGLLDLLTGAVLLTVSAVFLFEPKLAPFTAVLFFLTKPLMAKLKERYVHPRAGYVKLVEDSEREVKEVGVTAALSAVALVVSLVVLILVKGTVEGRYVFMRWVFPGAASVLFAMGPLYLGQKYALRRGYVLAFLTVAVGAWMVITGVFTGYRAVGAVCLQAGVFLSVTGTVLFSRFIRRNPLPEEKHEQRT